MKMTTVGSETVTRARTREVVYVPMSWLSVTCAVWSIARLTGADRIPFLAGLLVPILAFTPYAAIVSAAAVACACVLRRWRAAGVALVATGAFAIAVLPRAVGDTAPAAKETLLRVLTANLRLGHADPRALVDLVRRTRADVLSVQEFTPEAGAAFDRAGLGTLLPYRLTAPLGGALGSGLYARYPLHARPTFQVNVIGLAMPHAEMDVPRGGRVEVMAVHLARPMNPYGVGQWNRGLVLLPAAEHRGAVRILAGDFNATIDHRPLRRLIGEGYVDAAYESGAGLIPTFWKWWLPPITLDHVLVDARCAVRQVTVYDLPGSDHRAVFAELRLP
jgi:endonuclease/exonuclease/phosphatase (EEP) superfamily protein YafD